MESGIDAETTSIFEFPNEHAAEVLQMNVDLLREKHKKTEFLFRKDERSNTYFCYFASPEPDFVTNTLKIACDQIHVKWCLELDPTFLRWCWRCSSGRERLVRLQRQISEQYKVFVDFQRALDAKAFRESLSCVKIHAGSILTAKAQLLVVSSDAQVKSSLENHFQQDIKPGLNTCAGGKMVYQLLEKPAQTNWQEHWVETLESHLRDVFNIALSGRLVKSICFPPIELEYDDVLGDLERVVEVFIKVVVQLLIGWFTCNSFTPSDMTIMLATSCQRTQWIFEQTLQHLMKECTNNEAFHFYGLSQCQQSITKAIDLYRSVKDDAFISKYWFCSDSFSSLSQEKLQEWSSSAREVYAVLDVYKHQQGSYLLLRGPKESCAWLVHVIQAELDSIASRFRRSFTFEVPSHWHTDFGDTPQLVVVDEHSKEYEKVLELLKSDGAPNITVEKVQKVQNLSLLTHYELHKKIVSEDMKNSSLPVERHLWHGTATSSAKEICLKNFNRRFAGRNGTALGHGTYFAVNPSYSLRRTYSPPDANGTRCLILASVVTGRFIKGTATMCTPPDGFHSVVDDENNPTIFSVFSDNAAYPSYQILFRLIY